MSVFVLLVLVHLRNVWLRHVVRLRHVVVGGVLGRLAADYDGDGGELHGGLAVLVGQWRRRGEVGPLRLEAVLVGYVGEGDGVAVFVVVGDGALLDEGLFVFVAFVLDVAGFFGLDAVACFVAKKKSRID